MKLSPVSFNLNNQIRNNKIQNQPRLKPMASDCVSFGANIPEKLKTESKYRYLTGTVLSSDPKHSKKILEEYQNLKDDDSISDETKSKILLDPKNTSKTGQNFCYHVCQSKYGVELQYEIVKAMLEASPNDETTKKLLLSIRKGYDDCPVMWLAGAKERKLLFEFAPDEQTVLDMIALANNYSGNLFHNCKPEEISYLANKLQNRPAVLAKLLLQKGYRNYLPIGTSGSIDEIVEYLKVSPDLTTLKMQLNACFGMYTSGDKQAKEYLHLEHYVEVLEALKTNEEKKEILLDPSLINDDTYFSLPDETEEKFSDMIDSIIQDEATTQLEALCLIQKYKRAFGKENERYFSQLEKYFESQIEE